VQRVQTPLQTLPDPDDIDDIAQHYQAGETTQRIGTRYGTSKIRVATILREQGIALR
jgi:hypothetical protein